MRLSDAQLLRFIRETIEFPDAKVCKHFIAANLLSLMEENGYPLSNALAAAIVGGDDIAAIEMLSPDTK